MSAITTADNMEQQQCTCVDNVCRRCKGNGGVIRGGSVAVCDHCDGYGYSSLNIDYHYYCEACDGDAYYYTDIKGNSQLIDKLDYYSEQCHVQSIEEFKAFLRELIAVSLPKLRLEDLKNKLDKYAWYNCERKIVNCGAKMSPFVRSFVMDKANWIGEEIPMRRSLGFRGWIDKNVMKDLFGEFIQHHKIMIVATNNGNDWCDYNFEIKHYLPTSRIHPETIINLHLSVL